ncbi:ferritin-like metal-binding protein YciE [Filimonas zeae]|uniref:YciE/YciF family protein n=1 Tax=Filimonas zeae TaxID=1737353 RepID=A0A917J317_9BACT|nr:ferritin-like domain-containing protein [Filimonas zeae]MDR6339600.1 ferritin-like metal-binding protein YciE [Filimonas zeae]GGH74272.1 YciE/YciF family protein [Filimonas zeae]
MSKASNTQKRPIAAHNQAQPKEIEPALLELFKDEIKDIYWAEKHLVKTLPKMQKAATSEQLATAIGEHLEVTKTHVTRLEQVFGLLEEKPRAVKCEAMEGLALEGASIIENTQKGSSTRDAGIILASQKIEHYEIATYGALAQLATVLNLGEAASLLAQTLAEEKQTDENLSVIAESINYEAASETNEDEEE